MEIEQKFQECIRDVNRKKKCEEKIADLEGQLRYLRGREARHKAGMEKALANADKLAGVSLSALLVEANSPSSALNENRRNAYREAINYESIVTQIKAVELDLDAERATLASLEGVEQRYAEVSEEYRAFCRKRDPEYLEIQKRIAEYESNKTMIRTVMEACKCAQSASDVTYAEMQKTRQIMKKRFVFTFAKKKQIDATQQRIEELQIAVRRFTNELAKIQDLPDCGPVRDERFLKFADYFFEDIFLFSEEDFDWSIAIGKIEKIRWTLEEAGNNLVKVLGLINHKIKYLVEKQSTLYHKLY